MKAPRGRILTAFGTNTASIARPRHTPAGVSVPTISKQSPALPSATASPRALSLRLLHPSRRIAHSAWLSSRHWQHRAVGHVVSSGTVIDRGAVIVAFDKVPKKLPAWWDDEDDEDDDEEAEREKQLNAMFQSSDSSTTPSDATEQRLKASGGDGSSNGNNKGDGGGGGGGGGDDESSGPDNGGREGPFAMIVAFVTRLFATRPMASRAVLTGILAMLGDIIAQRIAHHRQYLLNDDDGGGPYTHNMRRTASVGLWGVAFMGPALYTWYTVLNRMFVGTRLAPLRMMVVDQLAFSPVFNSLFMIATGLLEGGDAKAVVSNWRVKFWPSMVANWSLWPAAQLVNFTLVPKALQVFYVNCVALMWNTMLMYISHDDGGGRSDGDKKVDAVAEGQ